MLLFLNVSSLFENGNGKILRVEIGWWEWWINAVMLRFEAIATDISTKFWPGISGKTVCPFLLSLSFLSVLIIATHHCNCSADTSMQIFFKQILYCPIFFNHAACINLSVYRVVSCRVVSCRVVSCRIVSCRVVSCRNRVVSVSRYTRTCSNNRCRLKYPLSLSLSLPLSLSLSLARSLVQIV